MLQNLFLSGLLKDIPNPETVLAANQSADEIFMVSFIKFSKLVNFQLSNFR